MSNPRSSLDPAPLAALIRYEAHKAGGLRTLATTIATKREAPDHIRRTMQRWLNGACERVNLATAEDICDRLGVHPFILWPEFYYEACENHRPRRYRQLQLEVA